MLNKVLVCCCIILLSSTVQAQLYPFTEFNTRNGLINNRCGNISQDSAGYIWIGTDNGICNYDGRKFNFFPGIINTYYFGHSQPNMYRGHCLLGASNTGLARCAGNRLEFIVPSAKNAGHIISGLCINDSSYLLARYGGNHRLLLIKGKEEQEIAIPGIIDKKMTGFLLLLQDIEKNIWAGTDVGFFVYPKGRLENPIVIPSLLNKYVNCIKEDPAGNIFISSGSGAYKIAREQLKNIAQSSPLLFYQSKEQIPSLGFLSNGDILLGQMTAGIKLFSGNLQWIKDINGNNGINNTVWDIFTDRESNTWFATENGLLRMKSIDFIYFLSPASASTNIKSGAFYNNSFIYSNGSDLVEIKNDREYILPGYKDAPGYLMERMLVTPDNELWINSYPEIGNINVTYNTYQYLIEHNRATKKTNIQAAYQLHSPVNMQQSVTLSPKEMLFLTDDKKLYCYSAKKVQPVLTDSNMPAAFTLMAAGRTGDEIFLSHKDNGIFYCKLLRQANTIRLKLLQAIPYPAGVKTSYRKMLCDKSGSLWLASSGKGILLYQKNGNTYNYKKQISTPIISSVMITDLLQDSSGNIWMGTNNGIDKIIFTGNGNYTVSKGLFDNSLTGRMIYFLKERNNRLYIGTTGSIAIVNIGSDEKKVPPIVHINHIAVNNINRDTVLSRNSIFEPDENNISFEFVSPSFINEEQTAYQYQLEGADTAWSAVAANFMITYNQLKPGDYRFRVKAKNADNVWSEKEASFSFVIKKPFYKHWAFYFLCLGICCGFVYWLYRQRIAGILAVEKTRQRISKDLHDDIGSTLSSITLMNAVLKNKIEKKPAEAAQLAQKIEDTSRQMIQNMSDIVWSINPGNDTMDKLQNRLQQFCADVFEDTDTLHKLNFSDVLLKKSVPMQLRRDVYLICKEITNNAAKYSRAKNYRLSLSLNDKNICIEAVDDGIGFDNTANSSGNGLNNIKLRVETNKGQLSLNAAGGTRWDIKIPID